MSTDTLLAVFTGIVALAFIIQSLALLGIRNAMRAIQGRMDHVSIEVQKRLATVSEALTDLMAVMKPLARDLQTLEHRVTATSEIVHNRVVETDAFLQEFTDSARLQVARIQDMVNTISTRVEDTFEIIHKGVLTPATEVTAFMRGVKVAFDFFFRGRRSPSHQPHQDEEMFI